MPEVCVNTVACAEHLLSFWESGISLCAGKRVSMYPLINTLNAESLMSFAGR